MREIEDESGSLL